MSHLTKFLRVNHQQGPIWLKILLAIQIWWKLRIDVSAVIQLLATRSQQSFAHATTAQLSCHVQNFVAITLLESRWDQNEISIECDLRWKAVSGTGPRTHLPNIHLLQSSAMKIF